MSFGRIYLVALFFALTVHAVSSYWLNGSAFVFALMYPGWLVHAVIGGLHGASPVVLAIANVVEIALNACIYAAIIYCILRIARRKADKNHSTDSGR